MSAATALPVLAATGLAAEARIAGGPGVVALAGGGDPARLALLLQAALERGAKGVISFGIAGGLAPDIEPGTVLLARAVHHQTSSWTADEAWTDRLASLLPRALRADLVGVDHVVAGQDGKAALRRRTGAAGVDMESHVAARLAAQHGVPFAALRIVADPAHRTLPDAAAVGMRPDGSTDIGAVLRALARRPGDIPALIRTALDAGVAFAALRRSRRQLHGPLGFEAAGPSGPTRSLSRDEVASAPFAGRDVQVENG